MKTYIIKHQIAFGAIGIGYISHDLNDSLLKMKEMLKAGKGLCDDLILAQYNSGEVDPEEIKLIEVRIGRPHYDNTSNTVVNCNLDNYDLQEITQKLEL